MTDVALPAEWDLYYEGWMIGDGEPYHRIGDVFEWFTVAFYGEERFVNTGEKSKSAVAVPDFGYRVCAEVIFLSEETCVLDFGIWAGGYRTNLPADCKVGDFVSGKIELGLPAIAFAPDELLKAYQWRVNRIFADLTPHSPETCMLDRSRAHYQEVDSTESVATHGYVLHCARINSVD